MFDGGCRPSTAMTAWCPRTSPPLCTVYLWRIDDDFICQEMGDSCKQCKSTAQPRAPYEAHLQHLNLSILDSAPLVQRDKFVFTSGR